MEMTRAWKALVIALALVALGAGVGVYSARYYRPIDAAAVEGLLWPNPKPIQPFQVVDQSGGDFGLERLQGKWSFLFFGYTHCPDICPLTLSVMSEVRNRLDAEGSAGMPVQMLFVTVDPERDSPERLAEYVHYFNDRLTGLGGTPQQVRSLTSQFGVAFFYGAPAENGSYLVDHSAAVFLTDPLGRLVGVLSAPHEAEAMFTRFAQIREFLRAWGQT